MTRRSRALVVFGVAIASAGLASAAVHRTLQQRGTALEAVPVQQEPAPPPPVAPRESGSGLPSAIPPGMRAISVKVNEVVGVAGFAVPGSHVDVLVALRGGQDSLARAVASNVQVLAVGTRADIEEGRAAPNDAATVATLLVAPADAERITLASMQGSITLTLRNPLDSDVPLTSGVRLAALVGQERAPQPPARLRPIEAIPESAPPAPKAHVIETIRAGKRSEERVR
jgi:pilus assembly protein CpaB